MSDNVGSSSIKLKTNRKIKHLSRDEYLNLTKEELIDRIIQLEAHNIQLKNIIQKNLDEKGRALPVNEEQKNRNFDFNRINKRHVLLKLYYLGWDYQGFATQEDSIETIEYHLFNALVKVCLIESRQTSNYHRCGRTDKGVSAFCQTISIDLRSKFPIEEQNLKYSLKNELNYCQMLNRVLPSNIRVIAWMPLEDINYSARFDCYERTYRYFFARGDLNVDAMRDACKQLIGIHDFRNLCKMDVGNGVIEFIREIRNADIHLSSEDTPGDLSDASYDMFYFELTGKAFLWHQVRCIMAVLVLVGQGSESPNVVSDLFDVEKNPCKPQYSLANDMPLNLYHCKFRSDSVNYFGRDQEFIESNYNNSLYGLRDGETELTNWQHDRENFDQIFKRLQGQWALESIKCAMMREMLKDLKTIYRDITNEEESKNHSSILLQGVRAKEYQKLLERKKCKSLENRIDHYVKKRRLDRLDDQEGATSCSELYK